MHTNLYTVSHDALLFQGTIWPNNRLHVLVHLPAGGGALTLVQTASGCFICLTAPA
jgi:hypothetical protein